MKVWGVSVSYYTGKLEAYLRYKGISYDVESPFGDADRIREGAGAVQVPIIELDDGRFMSDSTPIIGHLESEHVARPVMPPDPVVRFIALLIEDYADEWLWRAAMHYRWSYDHDRALLSRILADEAATHVRAPRFVKMRMLRNRQRQSFVVRDGVTDATQPHVESGYRAALANMTEMLRERPYLLGAAPSIADFGLMGPMLRHFGQNPTPAEIMRNEAPYVYEWLSRVWNAGNTASEPDFVTAVPASAAPMLKELAETHLAQLACNAVAFGNNQRHFDMTVQGCPYQHLPVSRYRVWCLERLRAQFENLDQTQQQSVRALLPYSEADVLWADTIPARSGYDEAGEAPFNKAINVYGTGVPE